MTLDDGSTDVLDGHLSQVEEAPRPRLRAGWVLGGALVVVAVIAGAGIAAVLPHHSSTPSHAPSASAAPSTPEAPVPSAGGAGTAPTEGPVVVQAVLRRTGYSVGLLTVGTGKPVLGLAPPVINFNTCGTDGKEMEYLPVEIREAAYGLAAAVTVQPGPTTPAGIGRLGFFFESHNGEAVPCREGAAWPMTDTFETVSRARVITGYVVLDHAVTAATPQGRPDVLSSLQVKISHVRQFDDADHSHLLRIDGPTVGQLCPGDQDAVCASLR